MGIDLGYNNDLTLVKKNAFKSASGLAQLSMWASSSQIVFEEQSLYTTASSPSFELYCYGSNISDPMFADDAFGNVGGGQLWDTLVMGWMSMRSCLGVMFIATQRDQYCLEETQISTD